MSEIDGDRYIRLYSVPIRDDDRYMKTNNTKTRRPCDYERLALIALWIAATPCAVLAALSVLR